MINRARARTLILVAIGLAAVNAAAQSPEARINSIQAHQRIIARENWQMKGRRLPGFNSAELRKRAIQQKLQMRTAQAGALTVLGGSWSSLGPLPLPSEASGTGLQDYNWISGRATAVAIDPNDPTGNTVFVGGAYGGVWKSINAGAMNANPASVTWTPVTDSQATLAIGAIAVQPQLSNPNPNTSIVLAGTGETNSSADSYYGLGILRSPDGGQTWTLISQDASDTHSFAGLGFSQIAFSSANPNLVVAAAASATEGIVEGLESPVTANRGIYYSGDAGATWHFGSIADSGVNITPASVISAVYNAAAGTFYAAVRFHGFYSSPDGANWTRLASQPGPALTASACPAQAAQPSSCPIYRGEIAVVPSRAGSAGLGEMYAWFVNANGGDQGIWKSLDGGASWMQINDSGVTNCGDLFGGCGTSQGTYNLALAAVPNGTATDLYAGAVNLYKCTITNAFPTCNGTGNNSFLNLTHVYGCSDIAKIHPDQHAIDFVVANGTALLYFANDGGIYRALDGFTGLTTGACGQTNQFDSLNAMLGPMAQFVSVSQSATDVNLLFGGTQDNGAPASAFSQSGGPWVNVNAGDNGFTAVNPTNENEWFVASPSDSVSGVNLFRCTNGASCHTLDFQNDQIADSNQLGGDAGAFYLPFILDPASSSTILLGTCRIWRGASMGGSFSLLSPDFETGGTGACTGSEINLVRSLAAGGPMDSGGYSQVIYAGTNGEGPLIPTTTVGGHVWVTTAADAGAISWTDRTGPINPQGFPVSAIAIDPSDSTGQTAYVGIMGFHTSHVWRTTDAGLDWTDFSANLPDAPVNSIVIDPGSPGSPGTIYAGTDVGIFGGSSSPNWTEVGPAAGRPGFLPNVAVTSLQIFNSGGIKRLRVATYGRGIWEWNLITTPDFQPNVSPNAQTILAGSSTAFNGTIWARNGYNSNVNLSCIAGSTPLLQTCSVVPTSILPSSTGTNFVVNAGGSAGDYSFSLHAVGTDPATVTHDFPLTLHVVDFSMSAPSPSTVTVIPGAVSASVSFTISASGAFDSLVTLFCSGLPQGASCAFQPSDTIQPTSGNPISVTLNISTDISTPPGGSNVTISASAAGESTTTQPLLLVVSSAPDYILAVANPSLTTAVNSTAVFNGTLTTVNRYNSPVGLSCGAGGPSSCVISPANVTPTASGAPFIVSASSSTAQSYTFNINGVGNDHIAVAHSAPVTLTVLPTQPFDFSMGVTPASASVPVGQSTTYMMYVNPTIGSFPNNATFSCSSLPSLSTCIFNPAQISAGSGGSIVMLTIATTPPGGTTVGTPAGTYNITIGATSGPVTHATPVTLVVTSAQSFDFSMEVTPPSASVPVGQSTTYTMDVNPTTGNFPNSVTFSCSHLPSVATCSFNPTQVGSGSGNSTVALTVTTTAPGRASVVAVTLFLSFPLAGLLWVIPDRSIRRVPRMLALLLLAISCISCGGGLQGNGTGGSGNPGTPKGTYTITVIATCGSVTHNGQMTLIVN
jgi:hypothetical protein